MLFETKFPYERKLWHKSCVMSSDDLVNSYQNIWPLIIIFLQNYKIPSKSNMIGTVHCIFIDSVPSPNTGAE